MNDAPLTVPKFKRAQSVLVVICTRSGEFLLLRRSAPGGILAIGNGQFRTR
ncbi:hypothetical protein [Chromatium okenii]|uniref:hypothetical protein n=1 Tax=Chromatium okenii TaxID=61644 RepID=UPI0032215817